MILTGDSGMESRRVTSSSNGRMPRYTNPVSPSAHETVTSSPSWMVVVASPVPTTAGMPSSRAMIAAWQVRPPRFVTIALARFMIGSQSGSVMSATSTSPGWNCAIWSRLRSTRAGPAPIRCPIARPAVATSPRSPSTNRRVTPASTRETTVSGRACRM